jgi:DNA primase
MALHRKSLTLQKELKAAERALALEQSQENFEILQDVQRQLESVEGTEAVVQGFGEASDRHTGTDF